ncbi:MAG TPA: MmgE/PrpD family protein [Stellaceae bacterium]|nr:MmgE/PrpD family protein [Stellaceae bacterium]
MDRRRRTEHLPWRREERRRFLKQIVATGAAAVAATLPAMAQEKSERQGSTVEGGQGQVAETLSRYAIDLKYEDLPQDVVRLAKRTILDTFGCAIGGYSAGPSQIAVKLASEITAKQGATVLCSGIKTSPELAVFANGVMIRYLDFNDGYVSFTHSPGHPSDTIAALLTPAELMARSGRDLIMATVLTYEVFCKVLDVVETNALGLDHWTVTGLAAAVGAGRLVALSQQQMMHAIGITVGGNTAIGQGRRGTLSNWKAYAAADACRKAMFSVELARNGMTGPSQVFEGRDGFFNVISRQPFTLPKLGEPYGIRRAFTKRFPLGQFSQSVAQAAVEARQFFKDPGEVREVNLRISTIAIRVMADSPDKWQPQTHETADHSIPYAAGVALSYGKVSPEYYEDPYLHDRRLLDLVSRVKCIPSEEADRNEKEFNLCDLEIVLNSGERRGVRVEYHRGHWKNPMTDAEMEEKFRSMAREHLAADRVDNLLGLLWGLETLPQVGALIAATWV